MFIKMHHRLNLLFCWSSTKNRKNYQGLDNTYRNIGTASGSILGGIYANSPE